MAIIPIFGVTKIAIKEKVETQLLKIEAISKIEETHLSDEKREVDRYLK